MTAHSSKTIKRPVQHVVYNKAGGWSVVREGANRASRNFSSKEDAVFCGQSIAKRQGGELVIHQRDGSILTKDTYVEDSLSPKGR